MSSNDIFTGERFVPGIANEQLEAEHLQRYWSLEKLVVNKVVLDAACGEGYGSAYMAQTAQKVIGVDLDEGAITRARQNYGTYSNLEYYRGDISDLSMLADGCIDVVVSFETIEHVPEEIQYKFMKEIKRVLKYNGILIMSTPNKRLYSDEPGYHNEFHIKEFYEEEFYEFIHKEFKNIRKYEQYNEIVSVIDGRDNSIGDVKYIKDFQKYTGKGMFMLAVASDGDIPELSIGSVYMKPTAEYHPMHNRVLSLQSEVEERNQHLAKLDQEISEKNHRIVDLQTEVEQRGKHNTELDGQIAELGSAVHALQADLQQKQTECDTLQEQIHNVEGQLEQQQEQIGRQQEQIGQQQEQIDQLTQTVRNKEGHIEQLLEVERAYEREKNTHSYKFAKKLQRMGDFVLPPNSRRRFFLGIIYNVFRHPILMARMIRPKRIKNYFKYMKLEGMSGVIKRYKEAEKLEKYQMDPLANSTVQVTKVEETEAEDIRAYDRLVLPKTGHPIVSIVIPVYNEFNYTYNCIKSIIEHSGDVLYEVLVANDCSTDITGQIEEVVENVRLITMKENGRFLLNCNNAAKYAKGKYILFLNNDTQVQENWLQPLIDLIESDEKIGMVGSKLIYPDGTLQEAGGILWKDASAWNYGHSHNPEDPEFNYVKEVDYISGAAIMIKASLWKKIGGFDERFVPAYCEDSDLAFEVRKNGYKVMYQPLSVVVHFEGVSNGTDTNSGQKSYQIVNQKNFYQKWEKVLAKEHFPNAENVFVARDRRRNQPVLLMVDHYVPQYDKDAGSRTVFQYLKLFVEKGFNVKFIGDNFYRHEPYTTTLQQMGIEVLYGPYYANHWQDWVQENADSFDYIFLNRPHISVKYIDFLRQTTKAKIIYYGHDLHFLREMRNYELMRDKKLLESSKDWKKKELDLMAKADVTYYPSYVEVEEIAKIAPEVNAKAIVAYMFQNVKPQEYRYSSRKDIMFIGGFTHTPNEDAVCWFVEKIWPLILGEIPDMKFYVLGSNPTRKVQELGSESVIIKGFVSDEELEAFYRNCRLSVVPLRFGAGIKGKVVEGMRYGIPVVTTSVGAEGITGAESILCVEDEPEKLAEHLCMLYQDERALTKMSQDSYKYIQDNFSEDNAWNVIRADFTK